MSRFIDEFSALVEGEGFNVFRVAEIKDGVLSEHIFTPTCAALDCYSVAKAFVVTALGFLYDDGLLSPDDKIVELLGDLCPADACPEYSSLTIDMAMRHMVGLPDGYLDIDVCPPSRYGTDFLGHLLTTAPKYTPGTRSIYTDAAYYLLARTAEAVSGEPLETLMWRRLFTPLDFGEAAWSKCPQGHAMGATGLFISTSDMAKLGQLYIDGGVYDGKRILSKVWVQTVLDRGYELCRIDGDGYAKGGMYGQALLIFPKDKRVVAWHSCEKKSLDTLWRFTCEYKD